MQRSQKSKFEGPILMKKAAFFVKIAILSMMIFGIFLIPGVKSAPPNDITIHAEIKLAGEDAQQYQLNSRFVKRNNENRDCLNEGIGYVVLDIVNDTSRTINNPQCFNVEWINIWVDEIPSANGVWYFYDEICLDLQHSEVTIQCDRLEEEDLI